MHGTGILADDAEEASDLPLWAVSAELVPSVLFPGTIDGAIQPQVLGRDGPQEQAAAGTPSPDSHYDYDKHRQTPTLCIICEYRLATEWLSGTECTLCFSEHSK